MSMDKDDDRYTEDKRLIWYEHVRQWIRYQSGASWEETRRGPRRSLRDEVDEAIAERGFYEGA